MLPETHAKPQARRPSAKPTRWRRRLKWAAILTLALLAFATTMVRQHIRTLLSLRRIPNTNLYVLDYYCDYSLDEIRRKGMDPHQIEDSFIGTFFPSPIAAIARRVKRSYIPAELNHVDADGGDADQSHSEHCSTVTFESESGKVFFGRNFDWPHDACLLVRVHDNRGIASVSVIDLHYLNLNRSDLERTNLIDRLPLLFAPYYVMDGMNRKGVAISEMSVEEAEAPVDEEKPKLISATLMRIVLDYAESTEDAIMLIKNYNVCFPETRVHFMVCDATGDSRVVEFIDGEVQVTSSGNSWQVCTNSIVWNKSEEEKDSECDRYRLGSDHALRLQGLVEHADAVNVARIMAVEGSTMWTSVYALHSGDFRLLYKSRPDTEYRDKLPHSQALVVDSSIDPG